MNHIPYASQWIGDDDVLAVSYALKSEYLTQGPKVEEFEKQLCDYCGSKYAVAVNSGTSALHIACMAAGISHNDEVITSPITFVASSNCVLYCGGKPVFADIQGDTINIDPGEIRNRITPRTKAIIPVHFAGQPCDMEEIKQIADENKLFVIEDAAHALGAEYRSTQHAAHKRIKIGSCAHSDMTCLSFHAVKHITTGEGGAVLTNDEKLYRKLKMLRTHGITRDSADLINKNEGAWHYEMQQLGFNYRITDFQCALGISQLKKADQFIERRRQIAKKYNEELENINGLTIPSTNLLNTSSWHLYVIRIENNRKKVFETLRNKGIGVNVHYIPVYLQPYYNNLGYQNGSCPKAEKYYESAISLPLFPKMKDADVLKVVKAVREALDVK